MLSLLAKDPGLMLLSGSKAGTHRESFTQLWEKRTRQQDTGKKFTRGEDKGQKLLRQEDTGHTLMQQEDAWQEDSWQQIT